MLCTLYMTSSATTVVSAGGLRFQKTTGDWLVKFMYNRYKYAYNQEFEFFQLNFKQIVLNIKQVSGYSAQPGAPAAFLSSNHREKLFPANKIREDEIKNMLVSYHRKFNEILLTLTHIYIYYYYYYIGSIHFFSCVTFLFRYIMST